MNERIHVGACQCLRKAGQPVNIPVCQRQLPGIVTISGFDSSGVLVHDLLHSFLYGKHIIRLRRSIGQPAFVVKKYLLCLGANDRILRRRYVFHIVQDRRCRDSAFRQRSRNKFLRSTAGHIPCCIQILECRTPPCVHPISTACVSAHNIRFRPLDLHVLLRGESSTLNPLQSLAWRHVQIGLQELLILLRSDPLCSEVARAASLMGLVCGTVSPSGSRQAISFFIDLSSGVYFPRTDAQGDCARGSDSIFASLSHKSHLEACHLRTCPDTHVVTRAGIKRRIPHLVP